MSRPVPDALPDDLHAHLLTPSFALSGMLPGPAPAYENMSPEEAEALLVEMEPELRAADRDMHEIGMLEQKGVTAAGKLTGESWPRPPVLQRAHVGYFQTTKHCSLAWTRF